MNKFWKSVVIFVILLSTVTFYITDQYFYSWIGFFAAKTGSCDFKQITTATTKNDGFKKLYYSIDLARTAERLQSDQNYDIVQSEKNLIVSRKFGDLNYSITFEVRENQGSSGVYYNYSINCANCESPSLPGEKCTMPDFEIYKKIYYIVEDLSSDRRAPSELQSALKIQYQNF